MKLIAIGTWVINSQSAVLMLALITCGLFGPFATFFLKGVVANSMERRVAFATGSSQAHHTGVGEQLALQ